MRIKSILASLLISVIALGVFMSGCGAPTTNQNVATNKAAANQTNATNNTASKQTESSVLSSCSPTLDADISTEIWRYIKSKPRLKAQIPHFNFFSRSCVVTLNGWLETFEDFKELHGIISQIGDVRRIELSSEFSIGRPAVLKTPPNCPAGTQECRDMCIPSNHVCNIEPPDTGVTNSNTNSNGNSNSTP